MIRQTGLGLGVAALAAVLGDLKDGDGETVVLFTHADWREPVEFMHHCSTKWATFLIGLRNGSKALLSPPFLTTK